jgi:hypothetical protein
MDNFDNDESVVELSLSCQDLELQLREYCEKMAGFQDTDDNLLFNVGATGTGTIIFLKHSCGELRPPWPAKMVSPAPRPHIPARTVGTYRQFS